MKFSFGISTTWQIIANRKLVFYVLASGIPAVCNAVLTPILLKLLGSNLFASWAVLEAILSIGILASTVGAHFGALHDLAKGLETVGRVANSFFRLSLFSAPIVLLMDYLLLRGQFSNFVIYGMALAQISDGWTLIVTTVSRSKGWAGMLVLSEGFKALIGTALIASQLFLPHGTGGLTLETILLCRAFASVSVVLTFIFLIRPLEGSLSQAKSMIRYGFPLLVSQMIMLIAINMDRGVISLMDLGSDAMTKYIVHLRVAGTLNLLLLAPLGMWFPVEAIRRDRISEAKFFENVEQIVAIAFSIISLILIWSAPFVWPFIFPKVQYSASLLDLCISIVFLQGLAMVWNVGGLSAGRTHWNLIPPFVFILFTSITMAILAKYLGIYGIAMSRTLGCAAYAISFLRISNHLFGRLKRTNNWFWLILIFITINIAYAAWNFDRDCFRGAIVVSIFAFLGNATAGYFVLKNINIRN